MIPNPVPPELYTPEELKILHNNIKDYYANQKTVHIPTLRSQYMEFTLAAINNDYTKWINQKNKEAMYLTPLAKIPLLINTTDPILQIIFLWRLKINK